MQNLVVSAHRDEGLASFMAGLYALVGKGMIVTMLIALYVANSAPALDLLDNGLALLAIFLAPFGLLFLIMFKFDSMSLGAVQISYYVFAALLGLTTGLAIAPYENISIANAFLTAVVTFLTMALLGYTTKRDLTGFGNFLVIALLGIIVAAIVNIFMQSNALDFAISVIAIVVFAGLTASDTQRAKSSYFLFKGEPDGGLAKYQVMEAMNLYLNLLNLFLEFLRLMGQKKD